MIKTLLIISLSISLLLSGCSNATSNLKSYVNSENGYQFLYPNGWVEVAVNRGKRGVDVVFRDIIESSENLSVVISKLDDTSELEDLGTASDVGYRFMKQVNNSTEGDRTAQLIAATSKEIGDRNYYLLEYEVELPNQPPRHNLASVVVSQKQLYTFNLSTTAERYTKVKDLFETVAYSFTVQ